MTSSPPSQPAADSQAEEPELVALDSPADGVPDLIETQQQLDQYVANLQAGSGPVAVDAERASGYKYSQRAYLVQVKRRGAGIALIDPIALPDLSAISTACSDVVWILHAADQDLRCLAEVGLVPPKLFDTELAGRLLGYERVGLAAVVAKLMGLELAKEHSAADWSKRPLPQGWLNYAALDVEVLIEIYEHMVEELTASDKLAWAEEEFEAVRTAPPPPPRVDPWLRTSGVHKVRNPRGLAIVRALWTERDKIAQNRDVTPGKILNDRAIIAAAQAPPKTLEELTKLPPFARHRVRREAPRWFRVISQTYKLDNSELPSKKRDREGPPHPRYWKDRDPAAAARLEAARQVVGQLSDEHKVPVENLMQPDALRRFCWEPPQQVAATPLAPQSQSAANQTLRALSVRQWQIDLVLPPVLRAWDALKVTD